MPSQRWGNGKCASASTLRMPQVERSPSSKSGLSCGWTRVDHPALLWLISPSQVGSLKATVNVEGKFGELAKTIDVKTTLGSISLYMRIKMPFTAEERRATNMSLAKTDRQAVFKND